MKLFFIESPGRKVINVISNFLPTVIIPTVILLEGFCATIVHALLNIIDFSPSQAVCVPALTRLCQYNKNKNGSLSVKPQHRKEKRLSTKIKRFYIFLLSSTDIYSSAQYFPRIDNQYQDQ